MKTPPALTHPSPNHSARSSRTPVVAVCIHWTGGAYRGAVAWCQNKDAQVSYHEIIGPKGELAVLVPPTRTAWAVGKSKAPAPWKGTAGNAMTYNISLAGAPPVKPTAEQYRVLIDRVVWAFQYYGWSTDDMFRVTGHSDWADPPGRKIDPWHNDWLVKADVIRDVQARLTGAELEAA